MTRYDYNELKLPTTIGLIALERAKRDWVRVRFNPSKESRVLRALSPAGRSVWLWKRVCLRGSL